MLVRPARDSDAGPIAAIYAPHVTAGTVSFETEAPDQAAMAARMGASGGLYPWLVAEEAGTVIGYAYATRFSEREAYRWTVETTIYVAAHAIGHGVGRRLYGALLATLTAQGFAVAIGRIALPNAGSVALHAALGFDDAGLLRSVGWKGRWIDVALWRRVLAKPGDPPAEPLPFATVGVHEA